MHHSQNPLSSRRSAAISRSGRIVARPRRRASQAGFTIIEVALSAFVLTFGIATSIIALQMGFKALDVARDSTLAAQIMQSEIERLRLLPWNNASTVAKDSIVELEVSEQVPLSSMFTSNATLAAKFKVHRAITTDPDPNRADVRYITLTVAWTSISGKSYSRSFTTMYAKNGLYDYYYTLATA
jgi:Tfp pilus assembly protein PilV